VSEQGRITPEVATLLARWAGFRETAPAEHLAEIFENVRQVTERLYEVDVEDFEADFLHPGARAR
jgi:hypothetical protein